LQPQFLNLGGDVLDLLFGDGFFKDDDHGKRVFLPRITRMVAN
jgi:hypothetical protein